MFFVAVLYTEISLQHPLMHVIFCGDKTEHGRQFSLFKVDPGHGMHAYMYGLYVCDFGCSLKCFFVAVLCTVISLLHPLMHVIFFVEIKQSMDANQACLK